MKVLYQSELPDLKLISRGKVREIYQIDDSTLLFVASDRISAYDRLMQEAIPEKGIILNRIANFWFKKTKKIINNHLISSNFEDFPKNLKKYKDQLEGRSILVKKANTIPIEFIVRGYIAGSGWREYKKNGTICGIEIPDNIEQFEKLPEALLTPSTKAKDGHDLNISSSEMESIIGKETAYHLSRKALELYEFGRNTLEEKGIILADTKFEFGELDNGELILIDEVLTPDSSRFWNKDTYKKGVEPDNFDKQTLRNWLDAQDWDKKNSPPNLPLNLINEIISQYKLIEEKILE